MLQLDLMEHKLGICIPNVFTPCRMITLHYLANNKFCAKTGSRAYEFSLNYCSKLTISEDLVSTSVFTITDSIHNSVVFTCLIIPHIPHMPYNLYSR